MTIQKIARQAAEEAWNKNNGLTDVRREIADAVAVAVLREVAVGLAEFIPAPVAPELEDNRCFKHAVLDCELCSGAPVAPPAQEPAAPSPSDVTPPATAVEQSAQALDTAISALVQEAKENHDAADWWFAPERAAYVRARDALIAAVRQESAAEIERLKVELAARPTAGQAATLLTILKEEAERQHARAERAEASQRDEYAAWLTRQANKP